MTPQTALQWTIVVLAAIAILMVAAIASRRQALARSVELRQRFDPEYDRAVEQFGTTARAEHDLAARARRVDRFRFRPLTAADRMRFESSWSRVQAQLVDDPAAAVANANELIEEVMRARGYPVDDFDQRVADLSVDHATVVQHYRAARVLAESNRRGQSQTEDLRKRSCTIARSSPICCAIPRRRPVLFAKSPRRRSHERHGIRHRDDRASGESVRRRR